MRRAKIVCTLGPATDSPEQVQALVDAGMNVARINRSHGRAEDQEEVIARVRAASEASGRPVAILVDLQGPKIRLGSFVNDQKVMLNKGDEFTITTDDILGTVKRVSTTFKGLPGDCRPGDRLLIDDGNVAVRVTAVTDTDVITKVEVPGYVSNHKGLNLPGVAVSVPALSEKDRDDLRWAITIGADLIALSFVRTADDIKDVHDIMDEAGVRIPVIAKIEKPQAVENLFDIVSAFDGIMVARGDLGVEMPLEAVPLVQKRAIELARRQAKPVIVATQVLESMIQNPRPTRAEASDCANAILDGADAVMLSGETSVGAYPIEAVRTMANIIENVEQHGGQRIAPADPRGGAHARGRGDGRAARHHLSGDLHPVGGHRPAAVPSAFAPPAAGVHPSALHAQPAGGVLGRADLRGARGQAHRRHGRPGRRVAPVQAFGAARRRRHHRGGHAPGHARVDQLDPPSHGRRDRLTRRSRGRIRGGEGRAR